MVARKRVGVNADDEQGVLIFAGRMKAGCRAGYPSLGLVWLNISARIF
jgi:hypothetical protein